jgi:ribosomal protein S18 acetylase RimI-like enzyme
MNFTAWNECRSAATPDPPCQAGGTVLKSGFMLAIKVLTRAKWTALRDIRIAALRESPQAFLSTHERETSWTRDQWLAEFDRGDWSVGFIADRAVSLLGATRTPDTPSHECYLEYMWVAPGHRRSGFAYDMLAFTLDRLRSAGVRTALLYVLDGNEPAVRLYKRAGFTGTSEPEPLADFPGRSEELLQRSLAPGRPDGPAAG